MTGRIGADVEQLEELSKRFSMESQKIRESISSISNQLQNVWWKGANADRFREEWKATHQTALKRIADSLEQASAHCKQQAEAQRQIAGS